MLFGPRDQVPEVSNRVSDRANGDSGPYPSETMIFFSATGKTHSSSCSVQVWQGLDPVQRIFFFRQRSHLREDG